MPPSLTPSFRTSFPSRSLARLLSLRPAQTRSPLGQLGPCSSLLGAVSTSHAPPRTLGLLPQPQWCPTQPPPSRPLPKIEPAALPLLMLAGFLWRSSMGQSILWSASHKHHLSSFLYGSLGTCGENSLPPRALALSFQYPCNSAAHLRHLLCRNLARRASATRCRSVSGACLGHSLFPLFSRAPRPLVVSIPRTRSLDIRGRRPSAVILGHSLSTSLGSDTWPLDVVAPRARASYGVVPVLPRSTSATRCPRTFPTRLTHYF